jgi:hypothetical protein
MKVWGWKSYLALHGKQTALVRSGLIHLSSPISFDAALRHMSCRPWLDPDSEVGNSVSKNVILKRHGTVKLGQTGKIYLAILTSLK